MSAASELTGQHTIHAKPLRLFIAVEVPEDVKRAVAHAIEPWRAAFPRGRWAAEENWHVTLKFLGPTSPRLVSWVKEVVGAVAAGHAPVRARIMGLGAFPSARRARVLWAGIDDPANGLAALVADLETRLGEEFRAEVRRFHPHLTVARSEPPLRLPESFAETILATEPFTIDQLVLFRSHLRRPVPGYEPLRTFRLGR